MAIIRVDIFTEKAQMNKIFTDEKKAIDECNEFLFKHELNDGCTLMSNEDFIALNGVLADMFDDPMNVENFAEWHDISDEVRKQICEYFQKQYLDDDDAVVKIAELLDMDLNEVYEN